MAFSAGTTESQCVEQEGPGISSEGSREDATERCYLSSGPSEGAVPEQTVSGAEERWDVQAGGKFKSSEQVHDKEPLQDGGFSHPEGCPTERRLDVINRPQGCLLFSPSSTAAPEVTPLRVEGQDIRVSVPTIRAEQCTQSFHKLLKPILAWLRQRGVRMIVHLDDILVLGSSPEEGKAHVELTIEMLSQLGFVINREKSQLEPTQKIQFLGFWIDSRSMTISLPVEKVEKIKQDARGMIQKRCVSLRELTCLLGRMSATSQAVLLAPLCYRQLQMLKNHVWSQTASFEAKVALTDRAIQELHWWMQHLEKWNGKPVLPSEPDLVLETDASLLDWGAHCEETPTGGLWSLEERIPIAHKLSGVTGGSTSCQEDICKESHWCPHPSENGQYHGHILHQQDGRYKVTHSVRDGLQPLELVPRKRYLSLGRAPSGHLQCNGRCGISHSTILFGMGAQHECSSSHLQPIGQV